uniref:Eukaryotic translation initiation factor 2A n=1 Tax=Hirondellea gigas TaxID=1518452 RepID=A0A2P2HWN8_9CRUS
MASRSPLNIAIHDSGGLRLVEGCPNYGKEISEFSLEGKIKTFTATSNGKKLALILNGSVQILQIPTWKVEHTLQHPAAQDLQWSPGGGYLAVWCLYISVKKEGSGTPNLHIYDTRNGCTLLKSFYQISQIDWQPQWTGDDSVFARNVTSEVHFYKAADLDTVAHKRVQAKLKAFSLSPSNSGHLAVFFTPSVKGAPCLVQMFKYPHFKDNQRPITNLSFFKVDSVEFMWNKPCNAVLLLTSVEKGDDKSYYGERMVFLMNSKTEEAFRVTFSKDGPINAVSWTPDGKNFLAVYGNNPASCSMFNSKGDLVHNLQEGARNMVLVNPVSNLAMVGGSGNISPRIEVWELARGTRLCNQECPDVTVMQWSPCGQYLLTSTCSPRLRVNNGYRIYHYSGSLLMEYLCPKGVELYHAEWLPVPSAAQPFTPSAAKVQGIQSSVKTASTERYIPPGQRSSVSEQNKYVENCKQFLRQIDKYDVRKSPRAGGGGGGQPVGLNLAAQNGHKKATVKEDKTPDSWREHCWGAAGNTEPPLSKSAAKNKKRRETKRQKDEAAQAQKNMLVIEEPDFGAKKTNKLKESLEETASTPPKGQQNQQPAEGEKKVKAIKKKLQRIEKLKKDLKDGKELDSNQTVMINGESALLAELKSLSV